MPKVSSEKKYSTFVKGLITEASALTFPENASLDEDNFDLQINGSRSRRQGIDYEDGYALISTGLSTTILAGTRKSFHRWDFPGGASDVAIGVIRVYNKLWFINLLASTPSANLLNGGAALTITGLANAEIETTVINNLFVLVSPDLVYPVLLEYDKNTQLVSQSTFPLQVRDLWGVADDLNTSERPTVLSEKHEYNLINQGWLDTITSTCSAGAITSGVNNRVWEETSSGWSLVATPTAPISTPTAITCTNTTVLAYPSNSDIWTLGKIGSSASADFEKYDPNSLVKNSIDNTEAPRGAIVIDAFKRGHSRFLATGFTTLLNDEEMGRLSCVETYAGRVWFSGVVSNVTNGDIRTPNYSGYLFFSQIVTGKDKLGKCFQEADPTSPNISDIIDTDGGTIQLPEVSRIYKMVTVKDSLIIFAENGVWEIYGDTGGFKATNYQTAQISSVGITNPKSVVLAGDTIIYWAKAGIFVLTPSQATGRYSGENLSLGTIQTYYNSISDVAKKSARGFYDARENHIRWLYNDTVGYNDTTNVNHYNRQLNLDLTLQAFYKYSISPLATSSPYVNDWVEIPSHATTSVNTEVVVGTDIVMVGTDVVTVSIDQETARSEQYSFLTSIGTSITISKYKNNGFVDWMTANGVGADYSSYLITGYDTFGEIMRAKQIPHIFFYITRTEDGFTQDAFGNLIPNNQSSCMVQSQWNWSNSSISGKWGTPFQAYRYTRSYIPSGPGDLFNTGDSVIVTKNKLRGSGKVLSLYIYSESGKDLQLLGWSVTITGKGTP